MSEIKCPRCGSNDVAMREYKEGDRLDEAPADDWLSPFAMLMQRNETLGETHDYWVAEMDFVYYRCRSCDHYGGFPITDEEKGEGDE